MVSDLGVLPRRVLQGVTGRCQGFTKLHLGLTKA